jgi:hypothetical protein
VEISTNLEIQSSKSWLEDYFGRSFGFKDDSLKYLNYQERYYSRELAHRLGDVTFSFLYQKYSFPEAAFQLKGKRFNILRFNLKDGMKAYIDKFYDQLIQLNPQMIYLDNYDLRRAQIYGMISQYNVDDINYFVSFHIPSNYLKPKIVTVLEKYFAINNIKHEFVLSSITAARILDCLSINNKEIYELNY